MNEDKIANMLNSIVELMEKSSFGMRANTELKKFQETYGSFKVLDTNEALGEFLINVWSDDRCPRDKRLVKLLIDLYQVSYDVDVVYSVIRQSDKAEEEVMYADGRPKPAHKVMANLHDRIEDRIREEQ